MFLHIYFTNYNFYFQCVTMETGEDEGDDPLGHMTGDLDLNDNNHIITHRVMDCTEHIQVSVQITHSMLM